MPGYLDDVLLQRLEEAKAKLPSELSTLVEREDERDGTVFEASRYSSQQFFDLEDWDFVEAYDEVELDGSN